MTSRLLIFICILVLPVRVISNVANFEGKIKIVNENVYDTINLEISVKDNLVRIDELTSHNKSIKSYLVDLKESRVFALSTQEKLYVEVPLKNSTLDDNVEIIKTQNSMNINGINCYQWRVKDKKNRSEITYWVTQKELDFMRPLINILRQTQTPLNILCLLPDSDNYIPLLSVDRTLFRKVKGTLRVIDIKITKLPESIFKIPLGYRELLG